MMDQIKLHKMRKAKNDSNRLIKYFFFENTHIKVVKSEFCESVIKRRLDIFGSMAVIPQLAGDENILTFQARNLCKRPLNTIPDSDLISINLGKVEVSVANLECFENGFANGLFATEPGAVAQSWDFVAGIKKNGAPRRHFGVDIGDTREKIFGD